MRGADKERAARIEKEIASGSHWELREDEEEP
jgi:hypothetical protein